MAAGEKCEGMEGMVARLGCEELVDASKEVGAK